MKKKVNELNFKKSTIVDLNQDQLKTIIGGTVTINPIVIDALPLSGFPTSAFCHTVDL